MSCAALNPTNAGAPSDGNSVCLNIHGRTANALYRTRHTCVLGRRLEQIRCSNCGGVVGFDSGRHGDKRIQPAGNQGFPCVPFAHGLRWAERIGSALLPGAAVCADKSAMHSHSVYIAVCAGGATQTIGSGAFDVLDRLSHLFVHRAAPLVR